VQLAVTPTSGGHILSKGTYGGAVGRTVLQTEIEIVVGTRDPFLNDRLRYGGEHAAAHCLDPLVR
jgi:hypothetical protein